MRQQLLHPAGPVRKQRCNTLAFMPCWPANAAMEAPGCWHAFTNSALNSGVYVLCVRRVGYLGVSDSLSMVCTICYVHTILREGGDQLKMGSPDAYGISAAC